MKAPTRSNSMTEASAVIRPTLRRSATWPSLHHHTATLSELSSMMHTFSDSAPQPDTNNEFAKFEEALNNEPEAHFLSPVTEADGDAFRYGGWWSDDSDDEACDEDWNAGIMDFSLFSSERRRAEERHEPLDSKWDHLLSSQAAALERSNARTLQDNMRQRSFSNEDLPALTPDTSPNLRDNLEDDNDDEFNYSGFLVNGAARDITMMITPPSDDDSDTKLPVKPRRRSVPAFRFPTIHEEASESGYAIDSDNEDDSDSDDTPLSMRMYRAHRASNGPRFTPPPKPRVRRPGLRGSRTLSGKSHSWIRPSINLYPLGERPEEERRAELGLPEPEKKVRWGR